MRSSTLRCTLAGILAGPLGLRIVGERQLDEASEERLSEWMDAHLSLAVWPAPPAALLGELERQVVQALEPPLNRGHLPSTELRRRLRERRAIITHGIDDLWSAPDPALTDWRRVLSEYGQAFDGYRYAKLVRRCECSEVADEVWRRHDEQRLLTSSFADLRCALFWLQRLVHSAEQSPGWRLDADLERRVQLLYQALLEDWARVTSAASPAAPAAPADPGIGVPTQAELRAAAKSFDRDWGGVDEVLYNLCRGHPAHDDRRRLAAKIVLVGRAYSAGLERCVQVPRGGQAIMIVADHLAAQGAEVDALLAPLRALSEPLTGSDFAAIVAAHGRLLVLLAGACAPAKTPRSFAAKYLHFHAPVVPIYDEYARSALTGLVRWNGNAPAIRKARRRRLGVLRLLRSLLAPVRGVPEEGRRGEREDAGPVSVGRADGGDVKPPTVIVGYDPGGNGCHGIARLLVHGGKATSVEAMALATTEEVICFIEGQESLVALGVDTLSCWYTGRSSWRPADLWLRDRYPAVRNSVVNANALFGSMGVNGMAVLLTTRRSHPDVLITETHPKVLYHQMTVRKYDYARCGEAMDRALSDALGVAVSPSNDHEWDAALSAFAALEAFAGRWTHDLLCLPGCDGERCVAPCGGTHYYWPE